MEKDDLTPGMQALAEQLVELTGAMLHSVEDGSFDLLNEQLAERSVLLRGLTGLLADDRSHARAILDRVLATDRVVMAVLVGNIESVRSEIDQLSRWRQVLVGYRPGRAPGVAAYLDSTL